jgi:hypothetical protein
MNCWASFVITQVTLQPCFTSWLARSAALYAAMEPVTPRRMCFF